MTARIIIIIINVAHGVTRLLSIFEPDNPRLNDIRYLNHKPATVTKKSVLQQRKRPPVTGALTSQPSPLAARSALVAKTDWCPVPLTDHP